MKRILSVVFLIFSLSSFAHAGEEQWLGVYAGNAVYGYEIVKSSLVTDLPARKPLDLSMVMNGCKNSEYA